MSDNQRPKFNAHSAVFVLSERNEANSRQKLIIDTKNRNFWGKFCVNAFVFVRQCSSPPNVGEDTGGGTLLRHVPLHCGALARMEARRLRSGIGALT
jgi:hypothetical protein